MGERVAPVDPVDSIIEWKKCPLLISPGELRNYDVIEVVRLTVGPRKPIRKPGMSADVKRARDALQKDVFSMYWINELGRAYAMEAQWDKCANVLLRGWKRAWEIQDSSVRFHFLMKLCEVSYYLKQFRQALAVLNDVEPPRDVDEHQVFLIMKCRAHAANGDVESALKAFKDSIEGEGFDFATRVLAFNMFDLRKVGAYEAANAFVEQMAGPFDSKSELQMLDICAAQIQDPGSKEDNTNRNLTIAAVVAMIAVTVYLLYLLEQWSLKRLKM